MNRNDFNTLDAMSLGTKCFDPLIQAFKEVRIRGEHESHFYNELSQGQKILFMYRVYYDHVHHSPEELYWWSAYFLAQPPKWNALKGSFRHLGGEEGELLLENVERFLSARGYPVHLEGFNISRSDMEEDPELMNSFNDFYARFLKCDEGIHHKTAQYIRSHPEEFVQLI